MAKRRKARRCLYCRQFFQPEARLGRPQEYCKPSHRQRAYEMAKGIRNFKSVQIERKNGKMAMGEVGEE